MNAILSKKLPRLSLMDCEQMAKAIHLQYVSDSNPGIRRIRRGDVFDYVFNGKKVRNKTTLERIKSLVIPPAWENVWICDLSNGHLQVTGIDARNRKQYKYHPLWVDARNISKFYHLHAFGKSLEAIRKRVEEDLSLPGLPQQKVLAAVISLMYKSGIRVGNNAYEKANGSYGLTTLKDNHVDIKGSDMKFSFKGKKGVFQNVSIKSRRLARIVQQCKDIPGKELFQYYDENNERRKIDSGMVNAYIKEITGEDFTAKDFRTWNGTIHALLAFKELQFFETETEAKKKIVQALDIVSTQLGNTRTVCRKYYVHPAIISRYEDKSLEKYITELNNMDTNENETTLSSEEKIVMKILEDELL
ncbi:DNA topoisomerase IB [Danxiaibacter flavus]|uniref:DNA topoisomerase n=1 Tax=Danxiaibacter flavus TaxID=3049108 RepID=A0ABV3ZGD8_9BACT|nr:DNA topoisomerase IB [Chitinophagaceae bacterium DXS]